MAKGKHEPQPKIDKRTLTLIACAAAGVIVAVLCVVLVINAVKAGGSKNPAETSGPTEPPTTATEPTTEPTEATTEPTTAPTEPPTQPPTEPPAPEFVNPLTGLEVSGDISGRRPVAIMLNNLKKATPQEGIGSADIIYEIPVEGGVTRFMGIYQDLKGMDAVGSIRSARPYFVDIALGYDAVYIHAGGSDDAYRRLKESGIDRFDGVNGSGEGFYRDTWRKENMGSVHSLMFEISRLDEIMTKNRMRMEHKSGFDTGMAFAPADYERTGSAGKSVTVNFNNSKSTSFEYDEATKLYAASQYGGAMTDYDDGAQVKVRNIVVISAKITPIAGDTEGRLSATLTGSGNAKLIADGVARDIKWTRRSSSGQFEFHDADGKEILFSPGVTYIGIIPLSSGSVEVK